MRLEPIGPHHAPDLAEAADTAAFRYHPLPPTGQGEAPMRRWIEFLLERDAWIAFAIIDLTTNRAIGSSSFLNIRPKDKGLEIGSTWIAAHARGTNVNPEMKLLMLEHAFDAQGAIRVDIRTDLRNLHSQRAIEKLGAKREGVLHHHVVMPDGHLRDTVVYAILKDQWPNIRTTLRDRLSR